MRNGNIDVYWEKRENRGRYVDNITSNHDINMMLVVILVWIILVS